MKNVFLSIMLVLIFSTASFAVTFSKLNNWGYKEVQSDFLFPDGFYY